MLFSKGTRSWGLSPQPWAIEFLWLEVFAFCKIWGGGNFSLSANNDLALCYDDIYDHTSERVGTICGLDPLLDPIWSEISTASCPITKAYNNSHFHPTPFFSALIFPASINDFLSLSLSPFLISNKEGR